MTTPVSYTHLHLAMENYRNIIYRDSFSIARGTVNPLRFLEYKFSAFSLTDEKYLPKPVMQLRDTKGEVNLTFLVGKADLDDKNPQNQVELNRLNQELRGIETVSYTHLIRTRDSFAGKDAADTSAGTDYSGGKAGNMEAD